MSVVMVFTVVLALLMAVQAANFAHAVYNKIDLQNRVDIVALTLAKRQAIAMNKVVKLNHEAGEKLAAAVATLAFVGETDRPLDLPSSKISEANRLASQIRALATALRIKRQRPFADRTMARSLPWGGAAGEAMIRLRQLLVADYAARLGTSHPSTAFESAILNEWNAIDSLARKTAADRPKAVALVRQGVPATLAEADLIVKERPHKVVRIAEIASDLNEVEPGLFPKRPGLPVQRESPDGDAGFARSQIVASAWPFVLVRRAPLLLQLRVYVLSGVADQYDAWTTRLTVRLAQEIYRSSGLAMYVMQGAKPGSKGNEIWTRDREAADQLFSVVVLSHREARPGLVSVLFPPQQPNGPVAHAQWFLHSAPPQVPGSMSAALQPDVGWDTLNWSRRVASYPHDSPVVTPTWQPRWAARVMPVTRFDDCANAADDPFRSALGPYVPLARSVQTH